MFPSDQHSVLTPGAATGLVVGASLVAFGRRRGGLAGFVVGFIGAGMVTRLLARPVTQQVVRLGRARRQIQLHRSFIVHRPVHDVFAFAQDFENFPKIFGALRSVVDYRDGRSRWEVSTPSGRSLSWEASVTKYVPNSVIAWTSVAGSAVATTGIVRLTPTEDGCTRVEVELSYEPRDTDLREALHALIDVPRDRQMQADLARVDSYIRALPGPGTEEDDREVAAPIATTA